MTKRVEPAKILEVLVQNAQKGERYRLKLVDDPVVYEGIPLATPSDWRPSLLARPVDEQPVSRILLAV